MRGENEPTSIPGESEMQLLHNRIVQVCCAAMLIGCLISEPARAELTCNKWFEYSRRAHLSHGRSEEVASTNAAIAATFETIEVVREELAKRAGLPQPRHHALSEMVTTMLAACSKNADAMVADVLRQVRDTLINLEVGAYPINQGKP
jgi:hypothetical protein